MYRSEVRGISGCPGLPVSRVNREEWADSMRKANRRATVLLIISVLSGNVFASGDTLRNEVAPCAGLYVLLPGDVLQVLCARMPNPVETYRLRIGDNILVRFPSLPDYTFDQPVKPDGSINMPRLNSYSVAGMTIDQAQKAIAAEYDRIGWHPEFFMVVREYENDLLEVQRLFTGFQNNVMRSIVVGPDGSARFPVIGSFRVAGKTLDQVTELVQDAYNQRYPRLHFDIILESANGDRVLVYGAVENSGAYAVPVTGSLPELFSMAGGPVPLARLRSVVLINVIEGKAVCRKVNYRSVLRGDAPSPLLCPGTIVFVPHSGLRNAAEFMQAISQIVLFRGFSAGITWGYWQNP